MTCGHFVAVAAAAVQLTEFGHGEVVDDDSATSVVLDDLIFSAGGSAAIDGGGFVIALLFNTESVFADSLPPDVGDSAAALAVDTLDLVGTWELD